MKCPKIKAKCSGRSWQPPKNNVGDMQAGRCGIVAILDIKGWCRSHNCESRQHISSCATSVSDL